MVLLNNYHLNNATKLSTRTDPFSHTLSELQKFSLSLSSLEANLERFFIVGGEIYREMLYEDMEIMLSSIESIKKGGNKELPQLSSLEKNVLSLKKELYALMDMERSDDNNRVINNKIILIYSKLEESKKLTGEINEQTLHDIHNNVKEQNNIFSTVTSQSSIISFFALFLGIAMAIFLSTAISKPIRMLKDASLKVGRGNFDVNIPIHSRDEVGDLAYAFRDMTNALKMQRKQLEENSKNLEEKVEHRTHQLELRDHRITESEKRYDIVVKSTGQLVYDLDLKTNKITWNGASKEITGIPINNLNLNLNEWSELIHPEDRENAINELETAITKNHNYNVEYRFKQKDGSYKYVEDTGFFILGKDNKPVRMLGTMKDISHKKEFENQILLFNRKLSEKNFKLKELDKQKDAFISIAAHELKTPLTSIKGFAQVLRNHGLKKKEKSRYVELINKNSDRLFNLVLDLVDSSRISLGKISMDMEMVDLKRVLKDLKEGLEGQIKERGVRPIFFIEKGLPSIWADYERLLQVLRNLVVNAIHYTEKGTISVRIYKKDGHIQFEVKDTGQGIPKENQREIFSRFYQVDSSMRRKVGGSGLGLSVCKGLVELMKGRIWFESYVGKGTTFYFRLPIKKEVRR